MNDKGREFRVPDIAGPVAGTGPSHNTTAGTQNCPFGVVGVKSLVRILLPCYEWIPAFTWNFFLHRRLTSISCGRKNA